LPDLPHFKTYDAESKTEATAVDRVYGKRSYEVVLVPRDEGQYTIGRIRMAYFDTREARYRLLETNPIEVTALRSTNPARAAEVDAPAMQQEIQVTGRDLAHIHADLRVADDLRPLYTRGLFGILAPLPLLAVAAVMARQRRRNLLASDVALARSTRARKLAHKHLAAARKHLTAGAGEAFYAEVSRALLHYVGDKLNVSAAGATHAQLRERVHAAGAPEALCDRLMSMLERCDAARFAPGSMGGERLREALSEAEGILVDLDGVLARRRGKPMASLAVLLLAIAIALPAHAQGEFVPPAELLRRGHTAYEAGNFAAAVDAYERAERAGVRTGALYYNLGNAYYKSDQLGKAIASYRRAERLIPRDRELQSNLAHALARREDKAMQTPAMPLIAAWNALLAWLSLNEWILVCAAFYVLASAMVLWAAMSRGRGWLRIARNAALAAAGIMLVMTGARARVERVERGVVAVARLPVTSGPGNTYTTEFSLHEGADVRIESRREEWLRISVNRTLRGWVPAASVLPI
jgi:tetratricopeptide (TPR) repeat protein